MRIRIRWWPGDDLGVPVFVVNSELEALACYDVRQDDTDTFRYWESAGIGLLTSFAGRLWWTAVA